MPLLNMLGSLSARAYQTRSIVEQASIPAQVTYNNLFSIDLSQGFPSSQYSITGSNTASGTLNSIGSASETFKAGIGPILNYYVSFAATGRVIPLTTQVIVDERVSGAATASTGTNYVVNITNGVPFTSYTYSGSYNGSGVLNSNGAATIVLTIPTSSLIKSATLNFTFAFTTHTRTFTFEIIGRVLQSTILSGGTLSSDNPYIRVNALPAPNPNPFIVGQHLVIQDTVVPTIFEDIGYITSITYPGPNNEIIIYLRDWSTSTVTYIAGEGVYTF